MSYRDDNPDSMLSGIFANAHLCFIGSMLGKTQGNITTQGQILAELFEKEGVKVTCVSSKVNRFLRIVEIVATLIRGRKRFDIVQVEIYSGLGFLVADIAGVICRVLRIPLIEVLHGGSLPEFSLRYPNWVRRVLSRADHIIAPSQYLVDKLSHLNLDLEVIPNVIDIESYPHRTRNEVLPKLLWMRSFHPVYNPEMAIEVLRQLLESEPTATLTMAGPDKGLEADIREMVRSHRLEGSVRFPGFLNQAEKIKEFGRADIYINTNRIDNMPVSVVEARAMGLPVVATNVGGLPYVIEPGENGLLSESEDVSAMVENIKLLLDKPALAKKFSTAGRRHAEQSAWAKVRDDWVYLIENVIVKSSEEDFAAISDLN